MEKTKKQLVYTIKTEQYFDVDSNIDIEDILEYLRGNGNVNIESVKLIEVKE